MPKPYTGPAKDYYQTPGSVSGGGVTSSNKQYTHIAKPNTT